MKQSKSSADELRGFKKEKGPRETLVPVAKYGELELPFSA